MGGRPRRATRPARRLTRSAKGEGGARVHCPTATCCSPPPARTPTPRRPTTTRPRRCGCCRPAAARPAWSPPGPGGVDGASRSPATRAPCVLAAPTLPGARRRRRRAAPQGAQGREGRGDPARGVPGPVLGPRPRARTSRGCSPAACPPSRPPDARPRARAGSTCTDLTPAPGAPSTRPHMRGRPRRPHRGHRLAASPSAAAGAADAGRRSTWRPASARMLLDDPSRRVRRPRSRPTGAGVAIMPQQRSTPHDAGRHAGSPSSARRRASCATVARGLGPLAGRLALDARRRGADRRRRRGRPRAAVPRRRRRRRRGHAADRRRRRVHRPAGLARRAPRLRAAHGDRRAAAPVRLDAQRADQEPVAPAGAGARRPRCPGTLTEVDATAEDGTAAARLARAARRRRRGRRPRRCCCGSTAARCGSWNAWSLALEPVARGGPGVRGAAARPGAVDRLRPATSSAAAGAPGAARRTPT